MTSSRLSDRLNSSRRRGDPGKRWVRVVLSVLATVGVIDTGTITLQRWGLFGQLACPGGAEGCDKVLNSAWGSLLGQPLSLFGFLAYLAMLLMAVVPLVLKGDLRDRLGSLSWWGMLLTSIGMTVFSLLLMGVMVLKIQALCFFCVLSAVVSVSLLVFTLLGGSWDDRGQLLFRGVLVALAVGLIGLGWATAVDRPVAATLPGTPPVVETESTPLTLALAEHLTASGAVMYSAYWCPHCHDQKELFGQEASKKLKVIECAEDGVGSQKALCDSKGVQGFPTWEINGQLDSGVKPLERLAQVTGFRPQG